MLKTLISHAKNQGHEKPHVVKVKMSNILCNPCLGLERTETEPEGLGGEQGGAESMRMHTSAHGVCTPLHMARAHLCM